MQSKKLSIIESFTKTFIGLFTSYLATMTIYYYMNIQVSHKQNLFITAIMFLISIARGYIVRRFFNKY
jgi:hypothetical protein